MSATRVPRVPLRVVRVVVVAVVAVDLMALAALAVHRDSTTTRTTAPLPVAALAPVAAIPSSAPPAAAPAPGGPVNEVSPGQPPASGVSLAPGGPVPVTTSPSATPQPTPSTPPTPTLANCPLPLKPPEQSGGLQSLIDFAPAFGPFSAEAFAAASAYQPMLELLGPILAQYPTIGAHIQPELTAFLAPWGHLLDAVFSVLQPAYEPHREQVLSAETALATSLAPYAEKLSTSPLGGCLVDLEAALVNDTHTTQPQTQQTG